MKTFHKISGFINKHRIFILVVVIFAIHVFLRFYQLEERGQFSWDQVDFAWNAKNIIVNHRFPLIGMVARQDAGFNMGPGYYYLTAFFYWIFNLDPIASPLLAGLTSIITFFTLFYIAKKLFSEKVALVALFIHTFSYYVIGFDGIQWSVNFIAPISLAIFYALYNVLVEKPKYLIMLALLLGLSFHIHFTLIFYPIIIFLTLPFIPRNKQTLKYAFLSLPFFLVWFVPTFIHELQRGSGQLNSVVSFINNNYHGVHLKRIMQVSKDAFIEIEGIIFVKALSFIKYLVLPAFLLIYNLTYRSREKIILSYLVMLWFLVPWIVFSLYKGSISNYYFSSTRLPAIMIISYLIIRLISLRKIYLTAPLILFALYYSWINTEAFLKTKIHGVRYYKAKGYRDVKESRGNEFMYGAPDSYMYYYYSTKLYNWKWK